MDKGEGTESITLEEEAKSFFMNAPTTHDWHHTERVLQNALHIGRVENANLEVLRTAALLHDIAREEDATNMQEGEVCHAIRGAEMAPGILKKHGYDQDFIEKVVHCIRTHRFRDDAKPNSLEAKVLYDADKLDALGAVGVARAYTFGGEFKQKLYSDFDAEYEVKKVIDHEEHTPVVEFKMKLSKLKKNMLTEEGKRIAEKRHDFMVNFYEELREEVEGRA